MAGFFVGIAKTFAKLYNNSNLKKLLEVKFNAA